MTGQERFCLTACLVMGEDFIRGELGNTRIGVAIGMMADIRPLNHQPLQLPILS